MNRMEVYEVLMSIEDALNTNHSAQEKVDAVASIITTITGLWIESTTYEAVHALARQKINDGKMAQVAALVKMSGVNRLQELKDDATKMAAFYDFLKTL